eukprot:4339501-Prymnesium_polylepis.1
MLAALVDAFLQHVGRALQLAEVRQRRRLPPTQFAQLAARFALEALGAILRRASVLGQHHPARGAVAIVRAIAWVGADRLRVAP